MKNIEETWNEVLEIHAGKNSSTFLNEFGKKLKEQLTLTTLPLKNDPMKIDSVVASNYPNIWSLCVNAVLSGYVGAPLIYSVIELRSIPQINLFYNLIEMSVTEYTLPTITPNLQNAKVGKILNL